MSQVGGAAWMQVMAGLWPLLAGEVTTPSDASRVFYLSQRPYLVRLPVVVPWLMVYCHVILAPLTQTCVAVGLAPCDPGTY
jgi:hypothetical protein